MNTSRINYLFSEKEFDATRDLFRAVLIAASKAASQRAAGYGESLTSRSNAFDLDELMTYMPGIELTTGQVKSAYSTVSIIRTLRWLDIKGYLTVEKDLDHIQLESHLFASIAGAWAMSLGVTRHEVLKNVAIYATNRGRAILINSIRFNKDRREVVAA